jgi:hypothetical protein
MALFSEVCAALKLVVPGVALYDWGITEDRSWVAFYCKPEHSLLLREVIDGYELGANFSRDVNPGGSKWFVAYVDRDKFEDLT